MSQLRILSVGCDQLCGLVLGGLLPPVLANEWRMIKRVAVVGSWTCAPVASVHSSVKTFSTLYLLNIKLSHYNLHSVNCFLLHCIVWWILIHVQSGDHSHHQNTEHFPHLPKFPPAPWKSLSPPTLAWGNHWSAFSHYKLHFLRFCVNRIRRCTFLSGFFHWVRFWGSSILLYVLVYCLCFFNAN